MSYRKKLIEVSLPLEIINRASELENDIHVGTLSNLHAWWSRKPITTARAVLFSSLVDDPSEYLTNEDEINNERERLFSIIEKLVTWQNMNNQDILDTASLEIAKNVARRNKLDVPIGVASIRKFLQEKVPPIYDPFAGGGSIPLEAQRLGVRVIASDINPVAVLLNKATVELPPKFINKPPVHPDLEIIEQETLLKKEWTRFNGFIDDIRFYSTKLMDLTEKKVGGLYPHLLVSEQLLKKRPDLLMQGVKIGDNLNIVSWLWARSVECPNPACRICAPLVNKFWVSTHKGNEAWLQPTAINGKVEFKVIVSGGNPLPGTVTKAGAKCIVCDTPIPFDYIRQKGVNGEIKFIPLTGVIDGPQKRIYLAPEDCTGFIQDIPLDWMPETELPDQALGFRVQKYGIATHKDLFNTRQLKTLSVLCESIITIRNLIINDTKGDIEYANALITYLSLAIGRVAQTNNTLVRWLVRKSGTSKGTPAFDRPIVPMVWEFSEGNVFYESVGSWRSAIKNLTSSFSVFVQQKNEGIVKHLDASHLPSFQESVIVSTDPPYYDNIGYGFLSDFFYIWLRKCLSTIYPDIFSTMLSPKQYEIVVDPARFKGNANASKENFQELLQRAFEKLVLIGSEDYPTTIYYAFKQAEEDEEEGMNNGKAISSTGWESMLDALIEAGFCITGTWPIRTESLTRLRAIGSNALASSIVLVCRKRERNVESISARDFVGLLKRELPFGIRNLQKTNIAPVDLAQAALGPGIAIFSRYKKVLEADGSPMRIKTALALINQVLDEHLSEQEGEYDGDTRWALSWFEQYGLEQGPYGVAETLSKAKNTSVEGLTHAGFLEARGGKVRLLGRNELEENWDPEKDKRLTVWEAAQNMIRILDKDGEKGAGGILRKLGPIGEIARDLTYRLYTICERKGWAQEALAYNMLVVAWPRIKEQARDNHEFGQGKLL